MSRFEVGHLYIALDAKTRTPIAIRNRNTVMCAMITYRTDGKSLGFVFTEMSKPWRMGKYAKGHSADIENEIAHETFTYDDGRVFVDSDSEVSTRVRW